MSGYHSAYCVFCVRIFNTALLLMGIFTFNRIQSINLADRKRLKDIKIAAVGVK